MDLWTLISMALPYIRIISLLLFFEGIFLAVLRWMKPTLKPEISALHTEVSQVFWSKKTFVALKALTIYWLLGARIYKRSQLRWIMHTCILFSSIGLTILHVIPQVFLLTDEKLLFPSIPTWTWPIIYNILFALLMIGVAIASARRIILKDMRVVSTSVYNLLPIILILIVGITGFALVNIKMLGWQLYYGNVSILHSLAAYATLAFIPYGKFIHILAAPITTLAHTFYEMRMTERED